ncbi:MAG TPA: glycoside hydrolase family protein [Candidatus Kryptobacter bacterium]|nr:glycoside hydrolase family protein [Candidatus Kryptobacter bacterium]
MNTPALLSSIERHEGFVPYAYEDSLGYWTIGFGTLIDKRGGGITRDEGATLLANRLNAKIEDLDTDLPWWRLLDDARQNVLAEMAYQMGVAGLREFSHMLAYLKARQYPEAAQAGLDSAWAKVQSPARAKELMQIMASGKLPDATND